MRRHVVAPLLLALAACASPDGPKALERVRELEMAIKNRDEVAQMALREMKDQGDRLARENGQLRTQIAVLRADVDRLETRLAQGMLQPGAGQPSPAALEPAPDVAQRVASLVPHLRDPSFQAVEAVIRDLTPHASGAAAILFEELRRTPRDHVLLRRIQEIVSAFPPEAVRSTVVAALRDPATRMVAARIAERQADPALAEALRPHLATNDPTFRFSAALALVASGDEQGVPYLLQALSADPREQRILAYEALRRRFGGDGFGYDPWRSPADNAAAVRSWQDWWDRRRAGATDPP